MPERMRSPQGRVGMDDPLGPDLDCMFRLAFGRPVQAIPIPVPEGYSQRGMAFRLATEGVPAHVLLLRYASTAYSEALRTFMTLRALCTQHVSDTGAPDPYYFGWTARDRQLGLLVQFAEGRGLGTLPPSHFFMRIGVDFATRLARLHRIEWFTLPDLPSMPLRYIMTTLAQRIHTLRTPELAMILAWLMPLTDRISEQPPTLIHGDYRLEHVVAQGTRIALIYGWESAVLADPRFDVGFASAALSAYGTTLSNQFVDAYTAAAGTVPDLMLWETINALRILTQVATTLSMLDEDQRARFLQRIIPVWQGILAFVESRTGLPVLNM